MKKKLYCSILSIMISAAAFGVAISNFGNIRDSIFSVNHNSLRRNSFVINEDTDFTLPGNDDFGNHAYLAVALSSENSIQTVLVGFNLVENKLVLPAGGLGIITNFDPMNVGFNEVSITWTGSENNFTYSTISAFSYFRFAENDFYQNIGNMALGAYEDLETYAHVHVTTTGTFTESVTKAKVPGIVDTRHVVSVITADTDLTLEEVVFGTDCAAQVPVVDEIGTYAGYTQAELGMLTAFDYLAPLPFIGNGLYYFHQEQDGLYIDGAFIDSDLIEPVIDGFDDNDYIVTLNEEPEPPSDLYGRILEQTYIDNVVYSADITYCANQLITYKIKLTVGGEIVGLMDEWPSGLFRQYLSTEFADILDDNPLDDQEAQFFDITQLAFGGGEEGQNLMALMILGYEATQEYTQDQVAFMALVSYLRSMVADQTLDFVSVNEYLPYNWDFEDDEEYSMQISDGVHNILAIYNGEDNIVALLFFEPILESAFPTQAINTALDLPQGSSIIPYTGIGKFGYRTDGHETSFNVDVHYANAAAVNAYRTALEQAGFYIYSQSTGYVVYRSDVFEAYEVSISYSDIETQKTFGLYYHRNNEVYRYNSFTDALQRLTSDSTILSHQFPVLSGDYRFNVVEYTVIHSTKTTIRGIYIGGLGQAYVNDLINGATYNAYYNAYVFSEHSGDNYAAVRYEILPGGVRVEPLLVTINQDSTLLDSTEANALLAANFASAYGALENSAVPEEAAKYDLYHDAFIYAPESNDEKVYKVGNLDFVIYGKDCDTYANAYTQAAQTAGYTYSYLQNVYYYGNTDVKVVRYNSVEYDNSGSRVSFNFEPIGNNYTYAEFTSYANADLGDIESNFVSFPHEGNEEIFYHATGSNQVVVKNGFDNDAFIGSLLDDGFYYFDNSNVERELRKSVGTTLYRVDINKSGYLQDVYNFGSLDSRGFYCYKFEVINDYYLSFADAVSSYTQGNFNAKLLSALPTYDNNDESFRVESGYLDSFSMNLASSFDKAAFIYALRQKGYTGSSDYFTYAGEDFKVTVNFDSNNQHSMHFYFYDYTWRTFPTAQEAVGTLYYFASEYIPTPDETGNIIAIPGNYSSDTFCVTLKSTVNIQNYVNKFIALGYDVSFDEDKGDYSLNLSSGPVHIHGSICLDEMGYSLYLSCDNFESLSHSFNITDYEAYLDYRFGLSGISFLSGSYQSFTVTRLETNHTSNLEDIYLSVYTDSQTIDDLEDYISQETGYTARAYDGRSYEKVVGQYRYVFRFYSENFEIRIERIS